MVDASTTRELELALGNAVAAAIALPTAADREQFIAHYLLARHEGKPLPPLPKMPPKDATFLKSELTTLAGTLTRILNATRGQSGWPLRAVAMALLSDDDGGRQRGAGDAAASTNLLPKWWVAASPKVSSTRAGECARFSAARALARACPHSSSFLDQRKLLPRWWQPTALAVLTAEATPLGRAAWGAGARGEPHPPERPLTPLRRPMTAAAATAVLVGGKVEDSALSANAGRLPAWWRQSGCLVVARGAT